MPVEDSRGMSPEAQENKTYSLKEVTTGLGQGKKYRRDFNKDGSSGTEYLTPWGENSFRHDVVGNPDEQDGWGGSTQLTLSTLKNGAWAEEGWELQK